MPNSLSAASRPASLNHKLNAAFFTECARSAALGTEALLQMLSTHLRASFEAEAVVVGVSSPTGWTFSVQAITHELTSWLGARFTSPETNSGTRLLQHAAQSEAPFSLLMEAAPDLRPWLASPVVLGAPLRAARAHGAVLIFGHPSEVEGEDSALLAAATTAVALALDNTALAASHLSNAGGDLSELFDLSRSLTHAADTESFLSNFVVRAAGVLGFERAFFGRVEGEGCRVRWGAEKGRKLPLDVMLQGGTTRRVLSTQQPFLTEDISQEPDPGWENIHTYSVKQYLLLPVTGTGGERIGLLGLLDHRGGAPIGDDQVHRALAVAAQLAVALQAADNAQRASDFRKRADQLTAMSLEFNSALGSVDFVRSFTVRAAEMLAAPAAVLALLNPADASLHLAHLHETAEQPGTQRLVAEFLDDVKDGLHYATAAEHSARNLLRELGWEDITVVSLVGGTSASSWLGALCLGNRRKPISDADANLLRALAAQGSVMLENLRLFSRVTNATRQWTQIFDSLTDFIVVHDESSRLLRLNRSLANFVGVAPAELVGMNMRSLASLAGESVSQACPFCRVGAGAEEYVHISAERTYLVSTSRIHEDGSQGVHTVHVLKDITDRREAERRYRELFDNIQEGVFFSSAEGHFIEVNDALVRMLGYESREELLKIDIPTQLYLSPEHRQQFRTQIDESGSVRNRESMLRRKDGSPIAIMENSVAVRDSTGRVIQYRGVLLDLTEVKRVQGELQHERDFISKVLENTQSMIVVTDVGGVVTYANRRCLEGGGFEENLVGRSLAQVIAPSHQEAFHHALQSILLGQQVDNLELLLMLRNKALARFSVNLSPMRDEGGTLSSIVAVLTDITDAALLQAKMMHTEKMAAIGQLVSGVAHEVNNPLTAILGFAELLQAQSDLPARADQHLKIILNEAQRTKQIVQNLLSFARQMPPQRRSVQINEILRRTLSLRSYDFSSHNVTVVEEFDPGLPPLIGDPHQLQQVFLNIVNNAYDAVFDGPHPGRIEIETSVKSGFAIIRFTDNGSGIGNPERIFDPFFTTKEVGKGTGLGLSICYGIVNGHGGEILCSNNESGQGATFIVRLPLRSKLPALPEES